jgi:hypothetical protein
VAVGLLLAGVLFLALLPHFDGPHSRKHANEAAAVGKLLAVAKLQSKYAAAHPGKGFACELPSLRPTERQENLQYDPSSFLTTGMQLGYRFTLDGCNADRSGMVTRYKAAAVPVEQGTTGFRAFCIDETALMRYDDSGIGAKCLTSGRVLE